MWKPKCIVKAVPSPLPSIFTKLYYAHLWKMLGYKSSMKLGYKSSMKLGLADFNLVLLVQFFNTFHTPPT